MMIQTSAKRSTMARLATSASEAPPRAADVPAAWTELPGGVLDGGEIILLAVKPSMWRPMFDAAPWMVTCGALVAMLTWLGAPLPKLSLAASAQVLLLLAFARLGLAIVRWVPTWYVLTNRRVIDVRGVRAPRISACMLMEVRNTYLHATPAEKTVHLGTITFVTDHTNQASQVWHSIARSQDVHATIRRAIESAIDQQGNSA